MAAMKNDNADWRDMSPRRDLGKPEKVAVEVNWVSRDRRWGVTNTSVFKVARNDESRNGAW